MCREKYLEDAANIMRPWFESVGETIPDKVRISCGWPSAGKRGKAIGECWSESVSEDSTAEIFITPKISDSSRVLDILLHELVHAAVGHEAGHGPAFKRPAQALGLTGKMTATVASEGLKQRLQEEIIDVIGEYPHAALVPGERATKKQTTRLIKAGCYECGMVIRTTRTWLAQTGLPNCACGGQFEVA